MDPGFWKSASPDLQSFPERQLKTPLPGADLGIAFSGGGTRSATATVGQLRGLMHHDWLKQVKYVTAVSGGSWAAAPFVDYPGDLTALLGTYSPDLKTIDTAAFREHANGSLGHQIARSGLASSGVEEIPQFLPDEIRGREIARYRDIAIRARDAIRRVRGRDLPDSTRQNKTFSHMLGQIFLDPLVKDANRRPYGWTLDSAIDVTRVAGLPQMALQQVPEGRPFLIAGGTMIWNRQGFTYPRLIPVEYTPLYTGVRQQFGNLGGTYVMPWAYDRTNVTVAGNRLLVDKANVRTFTLADMIGSSGAAPQLTLILGQGVPDVARGALQRAAGAFPSFNPIAIRDGQVVRPGGEIAHGDGGFTDNLGLMPLLARQVRNIIAFVNSNSTYTGNTQLQSYFFSLGVQTGSGDKSMNAVFPAGKLPQAARRVRHHHGTGRSRHRVSDDQRARQRALQHRGVRRVEDLLGLQLSGGELEKEPAERHHSWLARQREGEEGSPPLSVLRDVCRKQTEGDQAERAAGQPAGRTVVLERGRGRGRRHSARVLRGLGAASAQREVGRHRHRGVAAKPAAGGEICN